MLRRSRLSQQLKIIILTPFSCLAPKLFFKYQLHMLKRSNFKMWEHSSFLNYLLNCISTLALEFRNLNFFVILGWMLLDAVYYSFISLSTIGFGDFIPSMEPPIRYATYIRNDTACFEALINPIPSQNINDESGLSNLCNPTIWPTNIDAVF